MSVDLTLMVDPYESGGSYFGYVQMPLKRNSASLFDGLTTSAVHLSVPLLMHQDEGLTKRQNDAYGKPLLAIQAGIVAQHLGRQRDLTPWDQAVLAFIRALPADKQVVLYFH